MGKKQHQKDRLFLTTVEWRRDFGGYKEKKRSQVRALAFDCCALSLTEWENPYCTVEGHQFDLENIVPWIKKFGTNPVTGKALSSRDLIRLNYSKNNQGKYQCPLMHKEFNANSHIVAIRTSGNVFSYEAIEKLNLKPKFWEDLMTGQKFSRKDLITIQDPKKKVSIDDFQHVKNNTSQATGEQTGIKASDAVKRVMKTFDPKSKLLKEGSAKKRKPDADKASEFTGKRLPKKRKGASTVDKVKAAEAEADAAKEKARRQKERLIPRSQFSSGRMAASFTSTAMTPFTEHELGVLNEDEIRERRYERMKGSGKKAYVRMQTNQGDLNLQLHCDMAPRTCHSFLLLAKRGYYDNVLFHRLIISFMVQGGDPDGTGHGGECAWGGKMKDEFHPRLRHDKRGVLSMANAGPDTNGSQFFITFGECKHLDNVHSIFGQLVGGTEVFNRIELMKVDRRTKRPLEKLVIKKVVIFSNPFDNDESEEQEELRKEKEKEEEEKKMADRGAWFSNPSNFPSSSTDDLASSPSSGGGVGKYLSLPSSRSSSSSSYTLPSEKKKKKKKKKSKKKIEETDDFGDFGESSSTLSSKNKKKTKVTRFKDFSGW